jgi:uncharacterized protein (DUF3084 family)
MKQSRTVISAILVVAVLLTALGLTSCSKKNGPAESKTGAEPEKTSQVQKPGDANELEIERARMAQARTEKRKVVSRREREREKLLNLSPEERAKLKEQREDIQRRWENMSEEEKKEFAAKMRGGENMTEEEREKFMAELRKKFDAERQGND